MMFLRKFIKLHRKIDILLEILINIYSLDNPYPVMIGLEDVEQD